MCFCQMISFLRYHRNRQVCWRECHLRRKSPWLSNLTIHPRPQDMMGSNLNCIKKLWDDFEEEIYSFFFGSFEFGQFPPEINLTWVALIPKIDELVKIKDYYPISMVRCLY